MKLLESQFNRLAANPGDKRLIKQLAVEFGAEATRADVAKIREYRVYAASALRQIENLPVNEETIYVTGALHALLDAAACAEESWRFFIERKAEEEENGERE